ncbi:MAG: response regulator [Oscillospiraceae bacterium]|nr:response regulator [Oscillospiraceae bacterium]
MPISTENMKNCFANSPIAIAIAEILPDAAGVPADLVFRYANAACADLLGESMDALAGKCFTALFPTADDRLPLYLDTARNGTMHTLTVYRPDLEKSLAIRCYPIGSGLCAYMISDVTGMASPQGSLLPESSDYEKILSHLPGGVAVYDCTDSLRMVYCNDALCELVGYPRKEYLLECVKSPLARIHPDDLCDVQAYLAQFATAKAPMSNIHRYLHKNGAYKWLKVTSSVLRKNASQLLVYAVFQDVDQEMRMKAALEEQQNKLALAIQQAKVQYWEYDMHTDTAYISDFSQGLYHLPAVMTDFPESFLKTGAVHPDSEEAYRQLHRDLKNGASDLVQEIKLRAQSGEDAFAWAKIHYSILRDADGAPVRAIATASSADEYKEMEAQFVTAASQAGVSVWIYDMKDRLLRRKGSTPSLFGPVAVVENVPESLIARGLVHPDDAEKLRILCRRLRSGVRSVSDTVRWRSSASDNYWWERICFTTVFDKDGNPHHAIGSFLDVSIEKSLEQKYQEEVVLQNAEGSANLLAKMRSNVSQNVVEFYHARANAKIPDGKFTHEQGAALIVQSAYTDAQREQLHEMLDRSRMLAAFVAGETERSMDYQRRMNDGSIIWVNTTLKVYQAPESKDVIIFLYSYDITKSKNMQTIINKLVDLEHELIAVVDVKTHRVTLCATSAEQIPNHLRENEIYSDRYAQLARQLIVPEELEDCLQKMCIDTVLQALESRSTYSCTFSVRGEPGGIEYRKWTFSYLDESKSTLFYTRSNVTDLLTAQKVHQQALEDALLAAEQANAAKSDFLSRMSHEIRTPMNAIIGMSAIAAQSIGDDEQIADCISKIGISSRFLLSLINDILDMSRIESGKALLKSELIPFEEFINGINAICYTQAQTKNIDYECVVDNNVEASYIGDAMKLQQILINILSNAVKFTPENGKVALSVLQHKKGKNDAVIRFVVNDTGCGISDEFLPHLFEPFSQEHTGATTMYGGTGLGLAICKNLVAMMDGKINVRSIAGVGSEFTVEVKLGITEETRLRNAQKEHHNFSELRALVVDDDVIVCEHAMITLKEIGLKAEWVDSGAKAVLQVRQKWANKEFYDLILVDWKMPDMDGIETARQIRKIVGPDVTIIIMTAYDWSSIEHEAKLAGVNLLMSKPMFKSSLISAFEKVFYDKETANEPTLEEFDFTGRRVLLAEDHPLNVEVATRLLAYKGFQVDQAENGLRAMELFAGSPVGYYDAILMDIRMPQMDGLQAAYNIRHWRKDDAKTVPIIAMTANAFEDDIQKSRAAGMNAHLAKPIEPALLYRTLMEQISKHEPPNPAEKF